MFRLLSCCTATVLTITVGLVLAHETDDRFDFAISTFSNYADSNRFSCSFFLFFSIVFRFMAVFAPL